MFDADVSINGVHANYLKDLCELRGNAPDRDAHSNFKIFGTYVDAYILCPLIGYQYSRRGKMGSSTEGDAGIMAAQIIKRKNELKYVYQVLMLVDEESEPDKEKRIYRAFNLSEKTDEDIALIADGMRIYNEYFLGGIEVLHEQFVDECIDRDDYLQKMYQFTKDFNDDQDGDALKENIDKLLNM